MEATTIYVMPAELKDNITFDKDWRIDSFNAIPTTNWKTFETFVTYKRRKYQMFSVLERSGINRINIIFKESK
jgi:hypothetical protein